MKQLFQSLATGNSELPELPSPHVPYGHVLIRSSISLVSAGTERMLVDFGNAGLLEKVRQQPEKAQQVLQKALTDGVFATYDAVQSKLDQPLPLGYCNVGTVVAIGDGVSGFQVGDRLASNGPHAELVSVPHHLCSYSSRCFR